MFVIRYKLFVFSGNVEILKFFHLNFHIELISYCKTNISPICIVYVIYFITVEI